MYFMPPGLKKRQLNTLGPIFKNTTSMGETFFTTTLNLTQSSSQKDINPQLSLEIVINRVSRLEFNCIHFDIL